MRKRAVCLVAILLQGCAIGQKVADLRQGQVGWVSYPSTREAVTLSGELVLPAKTQGPFPAMIVVHGSGGLDDRNVRWARWFRENGIATFQIDYFGPRGVSASSSFQPTPVHDSYDALRLLATHPKIDPTRIGIIGFSRGGNIALETANATAADAGGYRFAGHVALYPSCGLVGVREGGSGAPVLVLVGTRDDLVPVFQCELMAESARARGRDVVLKVYEGAYHSWDGDFNGEWFQRSINRSYRMYSDQSITRQSEKDVLEFLNNTLMRAR